MEFTVIFFGVYLWIFVNISSVVDIWPKFHFKVECLKKFVNSWRSVTKYKNCRFHHSNKCRQITHTRFFCVFHMFSRGASMVCANQRFGWNFCLLSYYTMKIAIPCHTMQCKVFAYRIAYLSQYFLYLLTLIECLRRFGYVCNLKITVLCVRIQMQYQFMQIVLWPHTQNHIVLYSIVS